MNVSSYDSFLGKIFIAEENNKIVGVWFDGQKHFLQNVQTSAISRSAPLINQVKVWLDDYFSGRNPSIKNLPLQTNGTPFQTTVWSMLGDIKYGETATYKELAKKVASVLNKPKMSAQAVGGAVGKNPIAIIVPCHRVVGSSGKMVGYAGGIDKKIALLEIEKSRQ